MTALSARPDLSSASADLVPGFSRSADDRVVLRIALAAAVGLHVVALLLPWQRGVPEPPPKAPSGPVIVLDDVALTPPRVEPPPEGPPPPRDRLFPVPFETELPPDPVSEPQPDVPSDIPLEIGVELGPDSPAPPAPTEWLSVLDERTPGLVLPVSLERPAQEYPQLAQRMRKQGIVILRAVIDVDGQVTEVEVVSAPEPDFGLADSAVEAVSRWTYVHGTLHERPVAVRMTVRVEFVLE